MSMEPMMPVKFDKLRKLVLSVLGISLNQFLKETNVSWKTFWLMENEGKYSGATIQKILDYLHSKGLNCQPSDIMEYIPESEQKSAAAEDHPKKETPSA